MEDRIVVIEDDRSLRSMLETVLRDEGYAVTALASAEPFIAQQPADPSLVVLDIGLPGVTGLDVCSHLRRHGSQVPILMLTARGETRDRVRGLDAGADDYLTKPFALDELLARVRALLRRRALGLDPPSRAISIADLDIEPTSRLVQRAGRTVELTRLEFDLLHLLVRSSPAVVSRDEIHEAIWDADESHMSNSLEVFVSQLRRKTEAGGASRLVHTVRGIGYVARVA